MVSTKRRLLNKFEKINHEFNHLYQFIDKNVSPRPKIRTETVDLFIEKLNPLKEKYLAHNQTVQDANISNRDFFKDKIAIETTKIISCVDSLIASVKLKEVNSHNSQERFNLVLQSAGMNLSDLENVVKEHKDLVSDYFKIETIDLPAIGVGTTDRIFYEDMARRYKSELDELATNIFGKTIHTKLDVNVKEKNPHQHLGWINIGFEHRLPALIALVAHEGPFGHQTQHNFSENYSHNNFYCSQTSEGLAVLGQHFALKEYFGSKKDYSEIALFELVNRRLSDSLQASLAYLGYYKCLSAEEMAGELATEYYPEKFLVNALQNYNQDKLRLFNNDLMVAYHVGFNQINEIYEHAIARLNNSTSFKSDQEKSNFYSSLLRTMYTGNRTPKVMKMEVDLLFRQNNS